MYNSRGTTELFLLPDTPLSIQQRLENPSVVIVTKAMSLLVYVAASRVEPEAITDQLSRLLRDDERESEPVMTRVTNRNEFSPNQLRPR